MRKLIQVTGPIPRDCANVAAFVGVEVAKVQYEVEAIIRADGRWRIVPGVDWAEGIDVSVDLDARCYRIRVAMDDAPTEDRR